MYMNIYSTFDQLPSDAITHLTQHFDKETRINFSSTNRKYYNNYHYESKSDKIKYYWRLYTGFLYLFTELWNQTYPDYLKYFIKIENDDYMIIRALFYHFSVSQIFNLSYIFPILIQMIITQQQNQFTNNNNNNIYHLKLILLIIFPNTLWYVYLFYLKRTTKILNQSSFWIQFLSNFHLVYVIIILYSYVIIFENILSNHTPIYQDSLVIILSFDLYSRVCMSRRWIKLKTIVFELLKINDTHLYYSSEYIEKVLPTIFYFCYLVRNINTLLITIIIPFLFYKWKTFDFIDNSHSYFYILGLNCIVESCFQIGKYFQLIHYYPSIFDFIHLLFLLFGIIGQMNVVELCWGVKLINLSLKESILTYITFQVMIGFFLCL